MHKFSSDKKYISCIGTVLMKLGLAYLKHLQKRYCTGTTRNIIYCDPELMLRIREYIESCFERYSQQALSRCCGNTEVLFAVEFRFASYH
jgi:hypothetical protein